MKKFTCVQDIGNLKAALDEAFEIKKDRFKYVELGRNKTLMMIFFNSSLRTRLSTQKAAINLGMNVIVLDINQGAWKLETERGVIMDGDKPEHLLEAIPVMGCYCDIIGVPVSYTHLSHRFINSCKRGSDSVSPFSSRQCVGTPNITLNPCDFKPLIIFSASFRP